MTNKITPCCEDCGENVLLRGAELVKAISEAKGRIVRKRVVRDGKRQILKKRTFSRECPDGYKRDHDGKCVKIKQKEHRNRSKASRITSRKASVKKKRLRSLRKRG